MLDIDRFKKARIKEEETFEAAVAALQAALEARREICMLIGEPSKLNHDALILASRSQRARCKEIIDRALHVGLLARLGF